MTAHAWDNSGVVPLLTIQGRDTQMPIDRDYKYPIGETWLQARATDASGATTVERGATLCLSALRVFHRRRG